MLEGIGGVTTELVHLALDAALLRHQVIANNIANVSTPGFHKKTVDFEQQLSSFVDQSGKIDESRLKAELPSLISKLNEGEAVHSVENGQVELDQEMVELTQNVIRYQALLEVLQKRGDILGMAVREGRR